MKTSVLAFACRTILTALCGIVLCSTPASAAFNFAGIGITPKNNNGTTGYAAVNGGTYVFGTNVTGTNSTLLTGATLYYNIEDQSDTAGNGGFLGPQFGGQNYDAEFMGVVLDNTGKLWVNILTGQRFDNGVSHFSPGDIKISTSVGDFWVEVGGSANAGVDIGLGNNGSTYDIIPSTGLTDPPVLSSSSITAGKVVKDPTVINSPAFSSSMQAQIDPASLTTGAFDALEYSYTFYTTPNVGSGSSLVLGNDQHAAIETMLDLADILALRGIGVSSVMINSVSWMPGCGNDVLGSAIIVEISAPIPTPIPPTVPEPASLLIWAGALSMAVGSRLNWRRNKPAAV